MRNIRLISSVQKSNPRACARTRADSPAVSRKPADVIFRVKRDQVGNEKGPVKLLPVCSKLPGILNNRQGRRHSLVAAAGADHNRELTAIHAGVRTRSGAGLCPGADIIACFQKNLPDIGAVVMAESFL